MNALGITCYVHDSAACLVKDGEEAIRAEGIGGKEGFGTPHIGSEKYHLGSRCPNSRGGCPKESSGVRWDAYREILR